MKELIKKCIPNIILKKREHWLKQRKNFRTLAKTYNQYQSIVKWSCIDRFNNPIPWYSYPAIEFLSQFEYASKAVLEWGSGNSSLFWANRAKSVVSIEHDKEWFSKISLNKLQNQSLILQEISNENNAAMGGGSR